jgi:predicted acylesterase/phospholipase RssA
MRQVARATSAAPTYFEPAKVGAEGPVDYYAIVDGGVFANNPAICSYVEARKILEAQGSAFPTESDLLVVSRAGMDETCLALPRCTFAPTCTVLARNSARRLVATTLGASRKPEKPTPSPHALLQASGTTCCASAKKDPAGAALCLSRGVQWPLNMAVG